MTIKEMHYDLKRKLNKLDSQNYRNLLVPEIDLALNEAQEIFIKRIAEPRVRSHRGFEKSQRAIDDIRTIVVLDDCISKSIEGNFDIPEDYMFYLRGKAIITKGNCEEVEATLYIRQLDDEFEKSPFDSSSFEWRHVNAVFNEDGITPYTDGTFSVDEICISYIRKPEFMHNAEDFRGGTYTRLNGDALAGTQDCELPEQTHSEIVDLAVLIITGDLNYPDYQVKLNKLNLTNN